MSLAERLSTGLWPDFPEANSLSFSIRGFWKVEVESLLEVFLEEVCGTVLPRGFLSLQAVDLFLFLGQPVKERRDPLGHNLPLVY